MKLRVYSLLVCSLLAASCRQDMHDQPRFEPMEGTDFFGDGRAMRPQVEGTVARGELSFDVHLTTGMVDGEPAESFPFPLTRELLERGRERYDIFCATCHDRVGNGQGMAVRRGLKQPPSLHVPRLQSAQPGYLFDVITNGFGAMFDLSDRIPVEDRWAIVAYVRALQLSQNATLDDVPPEVAAKLESER